MNILRPLIGKHKGKGENVSDLIINDQIVSDSDNIANNVCEFFSNVGKKLQSTIATTDTSYNAYLSEREDKSIFLSPATEAEILNILNLLKGMKSVGLDGISSYLIKNVARSVIHPITTLINRSISSRYVPSVLKIGKVLPLHKSKESHD